MTPSESESTFRFVNRPPKYQLVDLKLGGRLEALLTDRRTPDEKVSYDSIAFEVWERTGVKVTGPTIRNWCDLLGLVDEAVA